MNMSASTVRLNLPRASMNTGFWARPSIPASPNGQPVEIIDSTISRPGIEGVKE
jgi:hypothetical protein